MRKLINAINWETAWTIIYGLFLLVAILVIANERAVTVALRGVLQ